MSVTIRMLAAGEQELLRKALPDVFDGKPTEALSREFLADSRHHLAVAFDGEALIGMASGVHYVHPDKPAELWINEIGVAQGYRRRGVGRGLLRELTRAARALGCTQAWVLTDADNASALRLYADAGAKRARPDPAMFSFDLREQGTGDKR